VKQRKETLNPIKEVADVFVDCKTEGDFYTKLIENFKLRPSSSSKDTRKLSMQELTFFIRNTNSVKYIPLCCVLINNEIDLASSRHAHDTDTATIYDKLIALREARNNGQDKATFTCKLSTIIKRKLKARLKK